MLESQTFVGQHRYARAAGLGLVFLAMVPVLIQQRAEAWHWLGPVLHSLLWPHLRWKLSAKPETDWHRQLLMDHALGGVWIALLAFNPLPSIVIWMVSLVNSGLTGQIQRLVKGMVAQLFGIGVGLLMFGIQPSTETSNAVIWASLLGVLLYPLTVGYMAGQILRQLSRNCRELERRGQCDGLTGLFNRTHWEALVCAEFRRQALLETVAPASLILADIDHFKQINDVYGHATGDAALRWFAQVLQEHLRETDSSGRYGGEEFGILLPHTSAQAACDIAKRLNQGLQQCPVLEGAMLTASFGIAEWTPDMVGYLAWMEMADHMLYQAKQSGRNRIAVADNMPIRMRTMQTQQT